VCEGWQAPVLTQKLSSTHTSCADTIMVSPPQQVRITDHATVTVARTVHPAATAAPELHAAIPRAQFSAPEIGAGSCTKAGDVFAFGESLASTWSRCNSRELFVLLGASLISFPRVARFCFCSTVCFLLFARLCFVASGRAKGSR
jgi:hypothetical protein